MTHRHPKLRSFRRTDSDTTGPIATRVTVFASGALLWSILIHCFSLGPAMSSVGGVGFCLETQDQASESIEIRLISGLFPGSLLEPEPFVLIRPLRAEEASDYSVNGAPVDSEFLKKRLFALYKARKTESAVVGLLIDRDLTYSRVVDALNTVVAFASEAGFENRVLVSEKPAFAEEFEALAELAFRNGVSEQIRETILLCLRDLEEARRAADSGDDLLRMAHLRRFEERFALDPEVVAVLRESARK